MNIPAENREILAAFVRESEEMLQRAQPFVRALARQPDREDIVAGVTGSCFRLFHSIKGTAGFLHLDSLAGPADAMEYLLDQVRSGILRLTPPFVALLAEACAFFAKGLPLVLAEESDTRLAGSSAALVTAIMDAMHAEQASLRGGEAYPAAVSPEMREAFLWETERLLEHAEQEFVLWDFISVDPERVAELVQSLSLLRRNFALFELGEFERLSQSLASTLDRFLGGEFFQTEYPERAFLRAVDAMRQALGRFIASDEAMVGDLEPHLCALQGLMRQPIGTLLVEAGLVAPDAVEEALALQKETIQGGPRRLGELLVEMGKVTADQVQDVLLEQHRKKAQCLEAEKALEAAALATPPVLAPDRQDEVRVDGRNFARIMELVGALTVRLAGDQAALPLVEELGSLLQASNLHTLAELVPRLKRAVHDLAVEFGRKVHFVVEGTAVPLGGDMVRLLAEPLVHLLRNAMEHGLESADERLRTGKRRNGRLTLVVIRQGVEVWISIEDDGRGMDREVRSLHAGATGESGLGWQAVQSGVHRLGGRIEILSRPGKGTRVTLKIPAGG